VESKARRFSNRRRVGSAEEEQPFFKEIIFASKQDV
jgi:hypothetical protein